ncbi:MAG: glycoside hydrolase family 38 C-terminal domain-containing protein, partial [Thermoanaerobacterium sp.]|nr:glycoside hydrolase family 38 C-terminal domain-containing protein [Thermoanaerobacterium sp.]
FVEVKATFRSALDRMNEFPEFVFTSACAAYYKWVEENAPEMFEEIKKRVKEGRWAIVGGWWIQPDCNIPSGESFVRHALYSQRYFLEKFGVMAKVGYNVDSFGHNGMLPQILKKSGMDYYVFMRPGNHENSRVLGNLFWWESPDGSRVMAYRIPTGYGTSWGEIDKKIEDTMRIAEEQGIDLMAFYGVGNHGGGPTVKNLESIKRLKEERYGDALIMSSPDQYFEAMSERGMDLPVYRDDLQHHASGCYSTVSEIKANNRRAEHALLVAEKFATIAYNLVNLPYDGKRIQRAWEKVMFNQFHDIMGGCSIKDAYTDARDFHGEALYTAADVLNSALQKMSWAVDTMGEIEKVRSKEKDWSLWEYEDCGTPVVVFNPHSWKVKAPVIVNRLVKGVTDDSGNPVALQKIRGPQTNGRDDKWNTLFVADVPAMGYRVYWLYLNKEFEVNSEGSLVADDTSLENDYIRLEIEPHTGYIRRLYDKKNNVEVLSDKGAVPVVIDINHCDTWAHGIFEFRDEIARFSDAKVKLIENGPIRAKLRVINKYNDSILRQDFILYRHKPDIEVEVKLDWREKHKMLKLSFPVNVLKPKATYEIPYGFIERPVNGEEEPGQQWIDLTGEQEGMVYGLALLNNSKYSFDIKDNDMRMTVVNGSIYADHFGVRDEFCEFMDQGIQEFRYALIPHQGTWQDSFIPRKAYEFNVKLMHVQETYHRGPLPQKMEGIKISADNVIATVFKKAEDGDDYILRCYETNGVNSDVEIEVPALKRKWKATFGKCEIKTFRIPEDNEEEITECNLIEF